MNHSIKDALHAAGIALCEVDVDNTQHSIRVFIGQGDDGQAAAQMLFESLPVGVLTLGNERYGVADMTGGIAIISLSRIPDEQEVLETEPYNARGRVMQPLEAGWKRAQPPTDRFLRDLYGCGVVGWDLHWQGDTCRLFVDLGCDKGMVAKVLRELGAPTDGKEQLVIVHTSMSVQDLRDPLSLIKFTRFPFSQPKPVDSDSMTVKHASELLDHTIAEVLSILNLGKQRGGQVHVEWGGCKSLLHPGPQFLTVDTDSLHAFLVDRGHIMQGSTEVGDPSAYIQARMTGVTWAHVDASWLLNGPRP